MHQLIIVGAGPAGLTAGLYAQRYNLDFIMLGQIVGGTTLEAKTVDNYPGFQSISGPDLMKKFQEHIKKENIKQEDVQSIQADNQGFKITTYQQNQYQAQSLILAMGKKFKKLGIKDEAKFIGQGISYCAVCDGCFTKNKIVTVVGGGDAALTAALQLADIAKKVYLIHRRDEFRGAPTWIEKVKAHQKIEIVYSANVTAVQGKKTLEEIILDSGQQIQTDWLFIEIGGRPALDLCQDLNIATEDEHLKVDKNQATNVSGVFAAGDITNIPFKQIVNACGQGAVAANSAYSYLKSLK